MKLGSRKFEEIRAHVCLSVSELPTDVSPYRDSWTTLPACTNMQRGLVVDSAVTQTWMAITIMRSVGLMREKDGIDAAAYPGRCSVLASATARHLRAEDRMRS